MTAQLRQAGPLTGAVLEGAYQIGRIIGEGGMGAVYEAVQLSLNKRVAVKLMARELAANAEAIARFRREAEIASRLGHPNLVNTIDFGTAETGEPYLVMEYLDGEDLDHRLRRIERLPLETVVHITKQVASALGAAHEQGIVHRDLKPGNVFLVQIPGELDFVKVLDFGISKIKAAHTRLTRATAVMGTPNYMSPEQATGMIDEIDHRADQWAMACMAWEMLSGRPPFVADDLSAIFYQVINLDPQPLSKRAPGLPPGVEPVLRRALCKKLEDRFPSIRAFAVELQTAALERSAGEIPAALTSVPPRRQVTPGGKKDTSFTRNGGELSSEVPIRRWKPILAVAIALALALVAGAALVLKTGGSPAKPGTGRPIAPAGAPLVVPLPDRSPAAVPQSMPVASPPLAPSPAAPEASHVAGSVKPPVTTPGVQPFGPPRSRVPATPRVAGASADPKGSVSRPASGDSDLSELLDAATKKPKSWVDPWADTAGQDGLRAGSGKKQAKTNPRSDSEARQSPPSTNDETRTPSPKEMRPLFKDL